MPNKVKFTTLDIQSIATKCKRSRKSLPMRKRKINDINQNHLEMTKMTKRDKGMKTCYKYIHIVKKYRKV